MKCPNCGSNSWQNPDVPGINRDDTHRQCDDCGQEYWTDVDYAKGIMVEESSGGSVEYYKIHVPCPLHLQPYDAECGDIIEALDMPFAEANMFKELWRRNTARDGRKKSGHSSMRGAEKLVFSAARIMQLEKYRAK